MLSSCFPCFLILCESIAEIKDSFKRKSYKDKLENKQADPMKKLIELNDMDTQGKKI